MDKIKFYLMLTRWREHVFFVIPISLLGGILGSGVSYLIPDSKLILVIVANLLMVTYAFMINDIEDSQDDSKDKARRKLNVVSSGKISKKEGFFVAKIVALSGLGFYYLAGPFCFIIGVATFLLSLLYSWRPVRLKGFPVTDIVFHSLMLSGLLFLAGFSVYSTHFSEVWPISAALILISAQGQLYNQIRDFDMDKNANLHNTTILIGERNARYLMYMILGTAIFSFVIAITFKFFPIWLIVPLVVSAPFAYRIRTNTDMRGTAVVDITGSLQSAVTLILNVTIFTWLVGVII